MTENDPEPRLEARSPDDAALPCGVTPSARDATRLLQALVGRPLQQLCVGVADLQLRFTDDFGIALESDLRVGTGAAVASFSLDGLALLLPLLDGDVSEIRVDERGGLWVGIGDVALHCAAHPDFEAWQCTGPEGVLVVSRPGGDLAVWGSD